MESLLLYILKSAGLISLFYIFYIFLLKNDTSFTANRNFLLGGIFTSLVLPGVYFTKKILVDAPEYSNLDAFQNLNQIVTTETQPQEIDWWTIAGFLYIGITTFFLLRFLFRIFQILKLIHFSKIKKDGKYNVVESDDFSGPFSFFNYLFINPRRTPQEELELMMRHEKVHARQFHSFDMLASHLFTAVCWFNPISWLYKKTVEQNLEFIADHETAKKSCAKQYQHVLVKVTTHQYQPILVNHFYQSFIKKRIVMLNKKSSNRSNISKMSLIFPMLLAFMLSFNVKTEAQVKQKTQVVVNNVQFYPDERASALITKKSTKEELEDFSKKFKKLGVNLQFKGLKYSKDGVLTAIKVKFKNNNTGDSGNYNKSGEAPIDPFKITLTEDQQMEFRPQDVNSEQQEIVFIAKPNVTIIDADSIQSEHGFKWSTSSDDTENVGISQVHMIDTASNKVMKYKINSVNSGKQQVIFVNNNGKSSHVTTVDSLRWKDRSGFKIEDTLHVYRTEKGKHSSVKVISDKKGAYLVVLDGKVMPKDFDADNVPVETVKYINVVKGEPAVAKYGKRAKAGAIELSTKDNAAYNSKRTVVVHQEESGSPVKTRFVFDNPNEPPVVYIDEELQKDGFDLNSIDPENIKSMMVLKSDKAIKEYGEKAKNGVIKITLKKGDQE